MGSQRLPLQLQIIAAGFLVRVLGANSERDSAACGELRSHDRFARRACFDEIVEDAVCNGFVERALVAIRSKIKFQGLALNAELVGHVIDVDPGEIWLAGHRTNGREIVRFKMNPIISAGDWIWECLETRFRGRSGNFCFAVSKQC